MSKKHEAMIRLSQWLQLSNCIWSDTDLSEDEKIEVEEAFCVVTKYFSDKFNNTLEG